MMTKFELEVPELANTLRHGPVREGVDVFGPKQWIQGSAQDNFRLTLDGMVLRVHHITAKELYSVTYVRRGWIGLNFVVDGSYRRSTGPSTFSNVSAGTISIVGSDSSTSHISVSRRPLVGSGLYVERQQLIDVFGLRVENLPEIYRGLFTTGQGGISYMELPMPACAWAAVQQMQLCQLAEPLRGEYLNAKTVELICYAVAELNKLRRNTVTVGVSNAARERVGIEIAENIYRNELSEPPSLDEVARRIGLNRNKLVDGFRERFGTTPSDYSRQIRLTRARDMLIGGGLSIDRVAAACGYSSHAAFSRAFRQEFGAAPSQAGADTDPYGPLPDGVDAARSIASGQ